MSKSFDSFADLPVGLQKEAIREAEKLLDAQLAPASAADQRALSWAGFLVAAATAALGGGVALFNRIPPDPVLGYGSILFGASMLRSAWLAIETVRPSKFAFPGNRPASWLPAEWDCVGTDKRKEQAARTDQARSLDSCICDNRDAAAAKARAMGQSFDWALWSAIVAGTLLLCVVTARTVPFREVASQVVALPRPHSQE